MTQTVRIARSEGYEISPRGVRQFYPQGDYTVGVDMPLDAARRCLESGVGVEVRTKATPLETKAPAPKKKKRTSKKAGGNA